ncbi:AraC family transcriptional regulator [Pseudomonas gessardii]|uniref:AraC family transcriptional regulator n=1 Tax=Pseudomonas gessardii TaxID=78544 RepID=UPI0014754E72|nr:AraC family transcriptional regulator [Pseudomonas gessardii]NNA70522.1 AraC family transcriptional regulator [Pseudomonas gessardii]
MENMPSSAQCNYHQLHDWSNEVNSTLVNLDYCATDSFCGFYQHVSSRDVVVARLRGTAHCTSRSLFKLRQVDSDFVLMLYVKAGDIGLSHRRHDGGLPQGSLVVLDSSKPHELVMDGCFEHIALRMSKRRFTALHPAALLMLDEPLVEISADSQAATAMLELVLSAGPVRASAVETMTEAATKMLCECVAHLAPAATRKEAKMPMLAAQMLSALDRNFSDPQFSSSRLAQELGVSRRYVDLVLSRQHQTFGKLLLERRLARCHLLLCDPRYLGRSITQIAFDCGFNDLSNFSKRFRERYGIAPRALRNASNAH